ncbi:MAG: Bug family tripartite tricarboxylate transporter substrate binding protein, partial [Burkholderiales bacterium]
WPNKPIRVVVPYAPGPVPEGLFRSQQPFVEARLGAKFFIENKPGADGTIGMGDVVRAAPDGYTLLLAPTGNFAVSQHLFKDLGYNVVNDLDTIATLWEAPLILVVPASLPVKTFKELEALIRANPGKFNYGSPGSGSPSHLTSEQISQATGKSLVYVPFKGTAPLLIAMLAGDIHMAHYSLTAGGGHLKTGKLRAISITSRQRMAEIPDVPTTIEAGYPQYGATNWWVLAAPRGTPTTIINRLANEFLVTLKDPEVIKRIAETGHVTVGMGPAETAKFVRSESVRYKKIVEDGKITAQ